jgi:uncharacterized DUF497 family protein
MRFAWDPNKAKSNIKKHGVGFEEAASVLSSEGFILLFQDLSSDEERFKAIGKSTQSRCIVVVFCKRFENEVRIISARKADKREVKQWQARI